jgi:predicted Zn-dependent peptidase
MFILVSLTYFAFMIGFERHRLANGLRVIVHRDPGTPMVTTNILYDAGARTKIRKLPGSRISLNI